MAESARAGEPVKPVSAVRVFPIRLGPRSRPLLRLFGVGPDTAFVELGGDLHARFGNTAVRTPISNIASWRLEGPWRWITAIGLRRSVRHGDLTFGGNHRGGVRIDFRKEVRVGPFGVPAIYVTVADLEGLAAALTELGVRGTDERTGPTGS